LLYRFKTWALACGRRDLVNNLYANPENYRLCAAHFDNEMFTNSQKSRLRLDATPKKQLGDTLSTFSQTEVTVQPPGEKPSTVTSAIFAEEVRAIPSTSKQIYLEIPASSSGVSHPSYGTTASQTGLTLSARTPRKQRLRRELQKQKEKSSQKEESMEEMVMQFNNLSGKLLPPNLATIVKTQVALNQQNKSQLRYSNEYKQFALQLFFLSPMAYRFLRTTFFLPTIRTV
jgi:hypothetical protein